MKNGHHENLMKYESRYCLYIGDDHANALNDMPISTRYERRSLPFRKGPRETTDSCPELHQRGTGHVSKET